MSLKSIPPALQVSRYPVLYNGKRQILTSKGLTPDQLKFFKQNPLSERWRSQVSADVVKFVDKIEAPDEQGNPTNELLVEEKVALFQNPVKYFSRPHNVPDGVRQQTYFPKFSVTLLRTPHLGPQYAQFNVPLWFNKLDLKSYLKNLYDVDVTHVRSFVIHMKQARRQPPNRYHRGQAYQPRFKKKMTVQLAEPFVWPAELSEEDMNNTDYDKKGFWESSRLGIEAASREQQEFVSKPNEKHRKSIAEQAKDLLAGRATWQPTWHQQPQDVRILGGQNTVPPLPTKSTGGSPSMLQ